MRYLKALGALAVLAAAIGGIPWLLITFIGTPVPPGGIDVMQPLTDEGLLGLIAVVMWVLWAQLMVCFVVEAINQARSASRQIHPPGTLAAQRHLAQNLIAAVVVAIIATPAVSTATSSPAAAANTPTTSATAIPDATSTPTDAEQQTATPPKAPAQAETITVDRGDTLWSLADQHLGDGQKWRDLAAANEGRQMVDGSTFKSNEVIRPGWELQLPGGTSTDTTTPSTDPAADRVVRSGDTLRQIAQDELGDANRYSEIFEASQDLDQPVPLTDPDRIYPGQVLDVPGAGLSTAPAPPTAPPASSTGPSAVTPPPPPPPVEVPDATEAPVSPRAVEGGSARPASPWIPAPKASAPSPESSQSAPAPSAPEPSADATETSAVDDAAAESNDLPSWVLPGLAGGGGLLAASMLVIMRCRRTEQARLRRPGAVPAATPLRTRDAEKSLVTAAEPSMEAMELLDQLLRRVATNLVNATGSLPSVAAVELTDTVVALHLRTARRPPEPWSSTDDQLTWIVDRTVDLDAVGPEPDTIDAAPWPLLVTVGVDEPTRATWLLNLEGVNLKVTGDPLRSHNFVRHVVAGVACNPWGRDARVDLVGIGAELTPIDPRKLTPHSDVTGPANSAVTHAVNTVDFLDDAGVVDVAAARVGEVGPELWLAKMVVVDDRDLAADDLTQLSELVAKVSSRSATAVVTTPEHADDARGSLVIHLDEFGRLEVTSVGLNLTAVSLTAEEATGFALLLHHAHVDLDEPAADVIGEEGWTEFATTTGSLRERYSVDRSTVTLEPASSVLPEPDDTYVEVAATTPSDLSALAPKVTESVRKAVAGADPNLDEDLAAWYADDQERPRLSLLGPVHGRASGTALARRVPFYTELFAFLALRTQGATADEIGAAFDLSEARSRTDANVLRSWLGADPNTGEQYLPDARASAAALVRGVNTYQVNSVLMDFDLFRRLRLRGESSGAAGIEDLEKALRLVTGKPFDQLRARGWGWLLEGARTDQHAVCAIADVAHLVVTARLAEGDHRAAREAVAVALSSVPDEEITRLDLAAVLDAEGHTEQALAVVSDGVCNRSEDGGAPLALAERTEEIIAEHGWARRVV